MILSIKVINGLLSLKFPTTRRLFETFETFDDQHTWQSIVFALLMVPTAFVLLFEFILGRVFSLAFGPHLATPCRRIFPILNILAIILGWICYVWFIYMLYGMLFSAFGALFSVLVGSGGVSGKLMNFIFYQGQSFAIAGLAIVRSTLFVFVIPASDALADRKTESSLLSIQKRLNSFTIDLNNGRNFKAKRQLRLVLSEFDTLIASGRFWLSSDAARLWFRLGELENASGDRTKALSAFQSSEVLYNSSLIGDPVELDAERVELLLRIIELLDLLDEPHAWCRTSSSSLASILELAPPEFEGRWLEMKQGFRKFHETWLDYAIANDDFQVVPEILVALQGRDIAADVLDRLSIESDANQQMNLSISEYQKVRIELRLLADRIKAQSRSVRPTGDDPDGSSRSAANVVSFEDESSIENSNVNRLLSQYRALRDRLPALREAAAEVPGFEILRAPHLQVTQAWLRESLAPEEAMLLAFVHDGIARAAVLRGNGDGALVDLPEMADNAGEMERFSRSLSGRSGLRDGSWPFADSESNSVIEALPIDRMSNAELAAFWDETGAAQHAVFWAPLAEVLVGVTRMITITHGRLQVAALSAGAPEAAQITQYPGLAFYALARGLYGGRKEPDQPAVPHISIVRGDHADLQYSPLEEEASVALWRSTGADVSHPDYPREGPIGLLHVTSHGDLLDDGSPVILLGRDASGQMVTLGERDILQGPPIEAAFLNLCLGGRLSEDPLDGSPSGLVSALMRRGAKVVVAALPPVDDLWACVLGLMVTEAMASEGMPLDYALSIAKARLSKGVPESIIASVKDWYVLRLDHVVREHTNKFRRSPDACAREALKAALESDGDLMLLAQLTSVLADVTSRERPAAAARFLAEPAWEYFSDRLSNGPGPAEYGSLVHGMITFGENSGRPESVLS